MNPFADGKRHEMGMDLFVKGFSAPDLITAYHRLTADHEQERLILETACIDEIDDEYNDGETIYPDDDIFEAVTVRRFSQTDSRMKALSRVFTKHLDDGITPGEAIIGKPKKSGLFATVTAQIPFSDGQVISIVFHSPDGNAKQIKPDDAIIAFRWLLNKRDITHVVSPEGEGEVSLEEVGKRISQLIAKNSARFQTTQKEIKEQRANLDTLKTEAGTLETENQNLLAELRGQQEDAEDTQVKIDRLKGLVERQKEINSDLENKLAGLRAAQEAEAARAEAERVAAEEQASKEREAEETKLKAEQEAAAEKRRQEIEAEEASVTEYNRLRSVGATAVPGVRSQDMENAGKLWEMLQRGEITQADWDKYVEDLYSSNKAQRPEPVEKNDDQKAYDVASEAYVSEIKAMGFVEIEEGIFGLDVLNTETREGYPKKKTIKTNSWINWKTVNVVVGNQKFTSEIKNANNAFKKALKAIASEMASTMTVDLWKSGWDSLASRFKVGDKWKISKNDKSPENGYYNTPGVVERFVETTPNSRLPGIEFKIGETTTRTLDFAELDKAISDGRIKPWTDDQTDATQDTNAAETEAISILNDLLAGKHDSDSDLFGNMLDDAAAKLEAIGLMEKHDALLNQVADYLTGLLEKEAA